MVKHTKRKLYRGGNSNYSSAASYGEYVNGNENDQYNRTFSMSGTNAANQSNILIGAQGQNSQLTGVATSAQLARIQSGGRRHKKRGGFLGLGQVINQAVVPFTLVGLQHTYRHKKHGGKTRRHKKHCKTRKHRRY